MALAAGLSAAAAAAASSAWISGLLHSVVEKLPDLLPPPALLVVGEANTGNFALRCSDPRTGEWEELPCRPGGNSGLYSGGAGAVLDGRIYYAGGRCLYDGITDRVDCFDPATCRWSSCTPMPTARANAAAVGSGGRLYVFGGLGEAEDGEWELDEAERYDPVSGRWEALPPLLCPQSFWGGAAVTACGTIYLVGGASTETACCFDRYDPQARSWTALEPLPQLLAGRALAATAGRLFAFGGSAPPDEPISTAMVFDLKSGRWTELAPMPSARRSAAVVASSGRLYILGGAGDFRKPFAEGPVEVLDTRRGSWEALPPLPLYMTQGVALALTP